MQFKYADSINDSPITSPERLSGNAEARFAPVNSKSPLMMGTARLIFADNAEHLANVPGIEEAAFAVSSAVTTEG